MNNTAAGASLEGQAPREVLDQGYAAGAREAQGDENRERVEAERGDEEAAGAAAQAGGLAAAGPLPSLIREWEFSINASRARGFDKKSESG